MSRFLRTLKLWPAGTPFPPGAISLFYDPTTDDEYQLDISRLGGTAGAGGAPQWRKDTPYPEGTLIYNLRVVYRASRDIAAGNTPPDAEPLWEDITGSSAGPIVARQWTTGKQTEGELTFDLGFIYRTKSNLSNSLVRPGNNANNYLLIGPGVAGVATSAGPYYIEYPVPAGQTGAFTLTAAQIPELAQATGIGRIGLASADGHLSPTLTQRVAGGSVGYGWDATSKTLYFPAGLVPAGAVLSIPYYTGVVGTPGAGAGAAALLSGTYQAGADGAQTITEVVDESGAVRKLDTAAKIDRVSVRDASLRGVEVLDSNLYSLAGGVLTVSVDAAIQAQEVLEVVWLTSGGLVAPTPGGATIDTGATQQVWVDASGNDTTGQEGSSTQRFLTIAAALKALGAAGGVVHLGLGEFDAPPASAIVSNTSFRGSGKPGFDTYLVISPSNELYFSAPPTKLVGGTVRHGTFDCSLEDNIKVSDLGVDVGSAWCAAHNNGNPTEGLLFAQAYNLGGGVNSYDGVHTDQPNSRQRTGAVVHNVTCLCKEAFAPVHAALFENLVAPLITNVTTVFGVHGIILKTAGGLASNLQAFGHGLNGLILKTNSYAYQQHTQVSNVLIGTVVKGEGGGIRFTDGDASANSVVYDLNLSHFKVVGTSFGVVNEGPSFDGLTMHDGTVSFCTGEGINLSNLVNSDIHHVTARGCGGMGITLHSAGFSTATALKSLGNGSGMELSADAGCRLDVHELTALSNINSSIAYTSDRVHVHGMIIADMTPTGTPTLDGGTVGGGIPGTGGGTYNTLYKSYSASDWTYGNSWSSTPGDASTISHPVYVTQLENDPAAITVPIPPGGGVLKFYCNRAPGYAAKKILANNKPLGSGSFDYSDYAPTVMNASLADPHWVSPFLPEGTYNVQQFNVFVGPPNGTYGVNDTLEVWTK
jgi:hypothetical protein